MKWQNVNVELVDEYAKQLSWEKRSATLEDQLYVVAAQNRKLTRLVDQVKYIITDSPLIMALPYCEPSYYPDTFPKLVWDVWNGYPNINIFVKRVKPFHQVGRHHNEAQSVVLDGIIKRSSKIRLIRDGIVVHSGSLGSLKRFKDDVKEVKNNYECGLNIDKFNDIKIGDIIEAYEEVEVARKL
jgi:hypothetical protein